MTIKQTRIRKYRFWKKVFGFLAFMSFISLIGIITQVDQNIMPYMAGIFRAAVCTMFFAGCTLCAIHFDGMER